MFTGLIQTTGTLVRTERHGADASMVIQAEAMGEPFVTGESIAVDGACLTVTTFQGSLFTADVSAESLSRTTLGRKNPGSRLNLERAMRLGDRLGGHLVSGHVDGLGILREHSREGRSLRLYFEIPRELSRYTIEKGSIAINGISLTINGCGDGKFDVNVIPQTAAETTIGELQIGQEVNLEVDLIGKYVERMLTAWKPQAERSEAKNRVSEAFLKEHGFL